MAHTRSQSSIIDKCAKTVHLHTVCMFIHTLYCRQTECAMYLFIEPRVRGGGGRGREGEGGGPGRCVALGHVRENITDGWEEGGKWG